MEIRLFKGSGNTCNKVEARKKGVRYGTPFLCTSAFSQSKKNRLSPSFWIICRFLVCTAFAALVKQGKTYFFKSSQTSRERRFGTETVLSCANALCQNCKKLRFLRLYAGFRLGMFFRRWNRQSVSEFSVS